MVEHIYYCGSFSPPTNAHKILCLDTIKYFLQRDPDSNSYVNFYFVPVSTHYKKQSVQPNVISWEKRVQLVNALCDEIIKELGTDNSRVHVMCETFEHDYSCELNIRTSQPNGYVGTYLYLRRFVEIKHIEKLHVLIGQDNLEDICMGPTKCLERNSICWSNTLHLVAYFDFVVFMRDGFDQNNLQVCAHTHTYTHAYLYENQDFSKTVPLDYWIKLQNDIKQNIQLFKSRDKTHCTFDTETNEFFTQSNQKIYGEICFDDNGTCTNDIIDIEPILNTFDDLNVLKEKFVILEQNDLLRNSISSTKIREYLSTIPMHERIQDENFVQKLNEQNVPLSVAEVLKNSNLYYNG